MKSVICCKCGKPMNLVTAKIEIQLINRFPVFSLAVATCSHCKEKQIIAAMDQKQMDAFKLYLNLQRKIRLVDKNHRRPITVVQMQKKSATLLEYMEARAPELMDKYNSSQKLKEKWKEKIRGKK